MVGHCTPPPLVPWDATGIDRTQMPPPLGVGGFWAGRGCIPVLIALSRLVGRRGGGWEMNITDLPWVQANFPCPNVYNDVDEPESKVALFSLCTFSLCIQKWSTYCQPLDVLVFYNHCRKLAASQVLNLSHLEIYNCGQFFLAT